VRLEAVTREYAQGGGVVRAVDGVTLTLERGDFVAVTGRSGSGKSTLLNLIAGIDVPTAGEVWVAGVALARMNDDALTRHRRTRIGMVHQFFNLLPTLSARENVALPALLAGVAGREALARADRLLAEVDLTGRRDARPATLSGGEMQRVAVARALVQEPAVVLADEPTGNLDSRAAADVVSMLRDLSARHGATVVLVTHSAEAAAAAPRILEMRDGRIVADRPASTR
jgi:putative ABC transport system ATP-binding protein